MPDVSQRGNYQHFRNEQTSQLGYFTHSSDFQVPLYGTWEFDYVSTRRSNKKNSKPTVPEGSFAGLDH